MSVKKILDEQFLTGEKRKYLTGYNGYIEVFKNPTASEFTSIATQEDNDKKAIRIGLFNGDVYAWMYKAFHDDMTKVLGIMWDVRLIYVYPSREIKLGSSQDATKFMSDADEHAELIKRYIPPISKIVDITDKVIYEYKNG